MAEGEKKAKAADMGKVGADPYQSDADWISGGGYDAAVNADIEFAKKRDAAKTKTKKESKSEEK